MWQLGWEGVWGAMNTCTCMAESLYCPPKTIKTLLISYAPVLSSSVMSDSLPTHGLQPTRVFCPWGFSRQEYWSGFQYSCPPPGDLPNPGTKSRSHSLQAESSPSETPGSPDLTWIQWKWKWLSQVLTVCDPMDCSPWNSPGQDTGVGSSSLLEGIFPTQGSNPGLPHCREILYYMSHQGSYTPIQNKK